jgi:pimeloyl-ACP methyl ester carboxylesterase
MRAPDRYEELPHPDGGRLGVASWGAREAPPVLFVPGAGTSASLPFGLTSFAARGLRLVALDRPGLGRSTARPGRTLRDFARDVEVVCEALDARPPVVGFSQGAAFALASGLSASVRRVVVVSGSEELAHPEVRATLPTPLREIVELVARAPEEAEAFFATLTAARFREMIAASVDADDRAVYDEPELAAAFVRATDEAFAQGAAGYARDARLAFARWDFARAEVRAPVALLYGGRDTSPMHALDHGARLERELPNATRRVFPERAGALPWTEADAILDAAFA